MAVMTSGCAWLLWRTTASTAGTGWTTLRAGGCRGESSTAGACSLLASTETLRCRWTTKFFPLSDHVQMLCILAGMGQKDTYAVGFGGDEASRAVFSFRVRCAPVPVHARRIRPLHFAFKAYCRHFGLQESQVRFSCDGLLSPGHSPDQLGLEDGDVIEAEEVYVEDVEEEEDDDYDEFDGTESRFPAGFRPMRMCRWFPSGNCWQGWGCMFAHSVSELHPLAREQGP